MDNHKCMKDFTNELKAFPMTVWSQPKYVNFSNLKPLDKGRGKRKRGGFVADFIGWR